MIIKISKPIKIVFSILLFTTLFAACENTLFDHVEDVDVSGWDMNQPAVFTVDVEDTITPNEVYLSIRHTDDYAWQNIFFFVKTTFPDKSTALDTVECELADKTGKWYGKGSGNNINARFLFKKEITFPHKGVYKIEIFHGMREPMLKNVKDVGLTIDKHSKNSN